MLGSDKKWKSIQIIVGIICLTIIAIAIIFALKDRPSSLTYAISGIVGAIVFLIIRKKYRFGGG